jgi:hypothetical protein
LCITVKHFAGKDLGGKGELDAMLSPVIGERERERERVLSSALRSKIIDYPLNQLTTILENYS